MIEFGVYLCGLGGNYQHQRDLWVGAENAGFDYVWSMDNVVGPVPFLADLPVLDTWTIMPALAEATHTIKFGPLVTPFARRHPAVLAKSSTVLDLISNGRFQLGMGPGDEERQHEPWGQAFPIPSKRIAILREELEIIKRMWTEEEASFKGEHYTIDKAVNSPKPFQKPHPPIWIGLVFGKKLMPKLAADYADGINVYNGQDDYAVELLELAKGHCETNGRDFSKIKTSRNVGITFTEKKIDHREFIRIRADLAKIPFEDMEHYFKVWERHIVGTPEMVAQELKACTIDLGFQQPVVDLGGMTLFDQPNHVEEMTRRIELFMNEVAPRVRELVAKES